MFAALRASLSILRVAGTRALATRSRAGQSPHLALPSSEQPKMPLGWTGAPIGSRVHETLLNLFDGASGTIGMRVRTWWPRSYWLECHGRLTRFLFPNRPGHSPAPNQPVVLVFLPENFSIPTFLTKRQEENWLAMYYLRELVSVTNKHPDVSFCIVKANQDAFPNDSHLMPHWLEQFAYLSLDKSLPAHAKADGISIALLNDRETVCFTPADNPNTSFVKALDEHLFKLSEAARCHAIYYAQQVVPHQAMLETFCGRPYQPKP